MCPTVKELDRTDAVAALATLRAVLRGEHPPAEQVERELVRAHYRSRYFVAGSPEAPDAFVALRQREEGGDRASVASLAAFESVDSRAPAVALLRAAVAAARADGADTVLGPLDGDTWHSYRFTRGDGIGAPMPFDPPNLPYYPHLWEAAGFEEAATYHTKLVRELSAVRAKLDPVRERLLGEGYRLRPLDPRAIQSELRRLFDLSLEIFTGNEFYSPITFSEFVALYSGAGGQLDPQCVQFAVAPDGADAGFMFLIRQPGVAVHLKSLGVVAAHRRSGLGGALAAVAYEMAERDDFPGLTLCLMHDANPSARLDDGRGETIRRYVLYAAPERFPDE